MKVLRSTLVEVLGLFVDDWLFTLLLVAWVAINVGLRRYVAPSCNGPVFFTGIALLLATFVYRRARELARKRDRD